MSTKHCAIYIRVSTDEQATEGYSIASQKQRLEAFCLSQDWKIYDYYIDDGFSGKDLQRPAVTRLINDAKKKQFDVVLIYRLDRLSRRALDLLHLVEDVFEPNGIALKSATEPFDTSTIAGRMMLTMLVAFAQFERESIAERVKINMLHKAKQGEWCGGNTSPFGYRNVDKQLVIDEKEAAIVRKIFELREQGHGYSSISIYLNERGMYTRRGRPWSKNTIFQVLTNPIYAGYMVWNRTERRGTRTIRRPREEWILVEGNHEAIISRETWQRVQELQKIRALPSKNRNPNRQYPLSGLIYCGQCGSKYRGWYKKAKKPGREVTYYACTNRCLGYGRCSGPMIQTWQLEEIVLHYLEQIEVSESELKEAIREELSRSQERKTELEAAVRTAEQELARLERAKQRIFEAYEAGALPLADFRERMEQINADIKAAADRIENVKAELGRVELKETTIAQLVEKIKDIRSRWENADAQERAALMRSIISRITVYDRDNIQIDLID